MELAAALRAEARDCNERRVLALAGEPETTRDRAEDALAAADISPEFTTLVGPESFVNCERLDPVHASELLGQTRTAVVYDAHESLRPNVLGQIVGAVDGGGLFVLLAPPLSAWPARRDDFDETLAVPPFESGDVTGHFRARLVETLYAHRGVAVVDVENDTIESDGLTDPAPRLPIPDPTVPSRNDRVFPAEAYRACLTRDQAETLAELEALAEPGGTVVVEADRGRGKSSAAGLAAGCLAASGQDVLVTAPQYGRAGEVFARARELLDALEEPVEVDDETAPRRLATDEGRVRYALPTDAVELPDDPDAVVVDEAAALPVRLLEGFLDAPAVAFTTTIHGYEGAGRGFSVRFKDRLAESDRPVSEVRMDEPIRYAAGDPVEVWATRALLLDARPPVEPLVADAHPETVSYERLSSQRLRSDEHLLREVFGLLVLAHYRTEPDDLARLLDGPNVSVRALLSGGHVVSVALLAREGGLDADRRADMYEGGRIRGNMLPDVLTTQLRDEAAGVETGWRVMRIATHHAARERGLGSLLLERIEAEAAGESDQAGTERPSRYDYLGVGFGATPELVAFWADNGYRTVHVSTTRNDRSGEHSAIMLQALSDSGSALQDRHTSWFLGRVRGMLTDPLADLDPDVVRAVLSAVDGSARLDLSAWEWRLLAGSPHGAGLFDTAPDAFRTLALRALTDDDTPTLTDVDSPTAADDGPTLEPRSERLLVRKVLQTHGWDAVAEELDFVSRRECMRALGNATERLLEAYGTDETRAERERFR
ncbi:tRNA(Met) cytidine acetyltransferase TmcA [Halapricum hydrolyticum]|uniref:tRNA(Met) cytidine acetyltransferase TmcA n=1 Tax=Halapricum hydrolyticum TaxID=2979991 RepID=A0AAE3ICS1_9EURY|nr:tRNA(Met) cytidine acetyltransferase TmcA [Halapricum hydrolyticum]MCU4717272.1 GNAT family N-acetyltransferase [Halapricum hydrolyticum]MCU4726199.1 GNAT family N-acetyltransferase [Halapricum hydrolyticum]